jgi:hypothetical protein
MKIENQSLITNHQSPVTNVWLSLEASHGLTAVPANWRRHLNDQFEIFKSAFLQKQPQLTKGYPCGHCACTHEIIDQTSEALAAIGIPNYRDPDHLDYIAICRCDPPTCQHYQFPLTRADVELWSLNWTKLARALCHAFGLNYQFSDLKLHNTHQIGSWSADPVPVILTIQSQRGFFYSVITELIARLRQKFILLAPTVKHFDANCQELLANANATFFPLDSNVSLNQNGNLHSVKSGGELFAKFTPQPKELDRSVAERAFILVQQLDSSGPQTPPSLVTVFRLYCIEEMSAEAIARKCRCSKAAIVRRLLKIREVTNADPRDLRRISNHLSPVGSSTSIPQATENDPEDSEEY